MTQPRQPEACPVCGTSGEERVWRKVTSGHFPYGGPLTIKSDYIPFGESQIQALVCTQCGYVQLCLDAKGLKNAFRKNMNRPL